MSHSSSLIQQICTDNCNGPLSVLCPGGSAHKGDRASHGAERTSSKTDISYQHGTLPRVKASKGRSRLGGAEEDPKEMMFSRDGRLSRIHPGDEEERKLPRKRRKHVGKSGFKAGRCI